MHGDQFGNTANGLEQHIVGLLKGLAQRRGAARDREQALVGNRYQGIDRVLELAQPFVGLAHTAATLELEGLGDDTDR
jgi:hypothetical protein